MRYAIPYHRHVKPITCLCALLTRIGQLLPRYVYFIGATRHCLFAIRILLASSAVPCWLSAWPKFTYSLSSPCRNKCLWLLYKEGAQHWGWPQTSPGNLMDSTSLYLTRSITHLYGPTITVFSENIGGLEQSWTGTLHAEPNYSPGMDWPLAVTWQMASGENQIFVSVWPELVLLYHFLYRCHSRHGQHECWQPVGCPRGSQATVR